MTVAEPSTAGTYRDRIVAVEPGGNEFIAEADRHGKPVQLFWTWTSPNLEFATVFVGVLAILAFRMTFWQAAAGIAIGTGLGAIAHYVLSVRGPLHGVPQMVLGRVAYWIGPWLGVVFADQYLRRGQTIAGFLYDRSYTNWNGLLSFLIGLLGSVALFSNQEKFVGVIAKAVSQLGDITFFVGLVLAGGCYLVRCRSKINAERASGAGTA